MSLHVHNVPANERVTIANLDLAVGVLNSELLIEDCAGPVHLEDITSTGMVTARSPPDPALEVRRCPRVTMARVRFQARGATLIEDSTVAAYDGSFQGSDWFPVGPGFVLGPASGLQIQNSSVELSRCDVSGGDGNTTFAGAPALQSTGGSLVIGGVSGTTISGGLGASLVRGGSLVGTGAAILDPVVTLDPAPSLATTMRPLPSLTVSVAVRGGMIQGLLAAEVGQSYAAVLGLPAAPVATPFEALWLTLQPSVVVRSGAIGASGVDAWSLTVPAVAGLEGGVLTWQTFATTTAGVRSSNPAEQVIL